MPTAAWYRICRRGCPDSSADALLRNVSGTAIQLLP
jgi:hypothetical protein